MKKRRPVVGIPEMGSGFVRSFMKSRYVCALKKAGAKPIWLAWTQDAEELTGYIKAIDGLLLPGGVDLHPSMYGEEAEGERTYSENRDKMEPELFRMALAAGIPILGICRGCQLINVALGGTLYQDIGGLVSSEKHMDIKHLNGGAHMVTVERKSTLYGILGSTEISVNSLHHQAVKELGEGLRIVAKSPEGIIEAIERPGVPFCAAVQWHPEHMAGKKEQRAIFSRFVKEASIKPSL